MEIKKLTETTIKEYGRIIQGDYFEPLLEKTAGCGRGKSITYGKK